MKQQQKLVIKAEETITGFNYAFAAALLAELKELNRMCLVYLCTDSGYDRGEVTAMAASVISYLCVQVNYNVNGLSGINEKSLLTYNDLNGIIKHAEKFLAIFHEK